MNKCFVKMDKDGNGLLSEEEFVIGIKLDFILYIRYAWIFKGI